MTKKPIVFSLVQEQSIFMTAIMSLLTFLAVLAFGIALAIGTGVLRWNSQWDLIATVQVMDSKNSEAVQKIINENKEYQTLWASKQFLCRHAVQHAVWDRFPNPQL